MKPTEHCWEMSNALKSALLNLNTSREDEGRPLGRGKLSADPGIEEAVWNGETRESASLWIINEHDTSA